MALFQLSLLRLKANSFSGRPEGKLRLLSIDNGPVRSHVGNRHPEPWWIGRCAVSRPIQKMRTWQMTLECIFTVSVMNFDGSLVKYGGRNMVGA
jgi:hypothetical protein